MRRTEQRRPRRAAAVVAVAAVLAAGGCSGDDGSDEPASTPTSEGPAPIATRAEIATVAGRLARPDRRDVQRGVVEAVDRWIDAAYLGDYPRDDFSDAFASFTRDAGQRARRESPVTSNAAVGEDLESSTATRRTVRIDVLAPDGRVAGATARVLLVLDLVGEGRIGERTDVVSGRLTLAPAGRGWEVFGWSLDREKKK